MNSGYIVVEGNSYQDALFKGLNMLGLREDQVNIEILESKKAFLFKKEYCKLKIWAKTDVKMEEEGQESGENRDPQTEQAVEGDKFKLDYEPDGVYLTVLINSKVNVSDILDLLNKKLVKNYDHESIIKSIENRGAPEKIAPYQEEILIDSRLQVNVSKDKLVASISMTEPMGGKVLTVEDIRQALKEKGIIFGIDQNTIEEVVEVNIFNENIIIARGKPPIDGEDAKVIYTFSKEDDALVPGPILDEGGRIDYKNLDRIRNVKADDLLMEIIPPTEGISGTDVYGNEIPAKPGSPANIKRGKNIRESEDGLKIYAAIDGEANFENNTIYVSEIITIDGNIDNETGNIKFNGKVNIKGTVKSGFKVEAEGDIEVFGVVENATLISKENITIHRGVQGNNQAYLHCLGDFKSRYIENANVRAAGSVEADAILHSNIIAKNKVVATGKRGLIVGGSIKAGEEVRANILGSNMGTSTIIEVGIDPEEKDRYESLKAEIAEMEKNIDNTKKAIDLLTKMSKQQKLTKERENLLVKSIKTYEVLKKKHSSIAEELLDLSEKLQQSNSGKIHSSVIIYSGIRAIIGNNVRQIYDTLHNCTLYVKDGEIVIGPYER